MSDVEHFSEFGHLLNNTISYVSFNISCLYVYGTEIANIKNRNIGRLFGLQSESLHRRRSYEKSEQLLGLGGSPTYALRLARVSMLG